LLINNTTTKLYAQKDTIYSFDNSITSKGIFKAKDSITNNIKDKIINLYGEASLEFEDTKLTAAFISFDIEKNEVTASYCINDSNKRVGEPIIIQNGEEIKAGKIRFNLNTKKGYIQEVALKQEEMYLQMETAKRQANEQIHFINGKLTTCDLKEPHFHFHLSKAILIPEKKIISKRMNIYFRNIPTPVGLPFLIIPQQKNKIKMSKHGFLMPKFAPSSAFGMGVSDLGYYLPFNDSIHTTFLANIYTSGSWTLSNRTEYKIKYVASGNLFLSYQQNNSGFPLHTKSNKFSIQWTHKKDTRSNPYWNFNSNVNFISDNNAKNIVDPLNPNYFTNTFKSDINLTRSFPNKPITMGLKISTNQNSTTHQMDLTSPIFNTNVTRFSPTKIFKKKTDITEKWYDKINMNYNAEFKNTSTFHDSLLKNNDLKGIQNNFLNGINQRSTLTTTIKLFKNTWAFTPSANYAHFINFQQSNQYFDTTNNQVITTKIQNTGMFHTFSSSARLTTQLYTYYKFIGKNKSLLRHILTPSFSYSFTPEINPVQSSYLDTNKNEIFYSPFTRSSYQQGNSRSSSILSFDFMNTMELKTKSSKDTISGFKKIKIIDAFSISGNYDFLKDSMKLSNISLSLRISPIKQINFVASSTFSPYGWDKTTKQTNKEFAWKQYNKIGRVLYTSFNTTWTLTSEKSRRKIEENKEAFSGVWNSELNYFALHPEYFLDFNIPWKVNFTHVLAIQTNTNITEFNTKKESYTHTILMDGDINITKLWKIASTTNFDVVSKRITNSRLTLTRNLHCWNLSFYVTPIGTNKSFLLRLVSNATLLQDAKLELRKPPSVF
jgi:hypothetical protein